MPSSGSFYVFLGRDKCFFDNYESTRVLPESHLLSVETSDIRDLAVEAGKEVGINFGDYHVVVGVLAVFLQEQFGQFRARNQILSLAIESICQSWPGFVRQSEINNFFKIFEFNFGPVPTITGGSVEVTVLQNQLLVVKRHFKLWITGLGGENERKQTCKSDIPNFSASL